MALAERAIAVETAVPTVAWGAVIGGAFIIVATAFILLAIGAGFGLSAVSPWPHSGASATGFAIGAAIWLIVVQWLSSALGGYVAGRLAARWVGVTLHEAYFRDTAHGVIAWAVAAVFTVAFLATAVGAVVGGTAKGATEIAAGAAQGASTGAAANASPGEPSQYLVDSLFRKDRPEANANPQETRRETGRILAEAIGNGGEVAAPDKAYLARLVAAQTGLSQDEAQKRVDDIVGKVKTAEAKVRQAAETARKAARNLAYFIGLSMLVGAFIAGVAAKIGGHHRERIA
jgi:hypothetical protein